jgi:hypothetical protein
MIDRYSKKVAITSQDRLQPMDKWEDYPIKVLDMAPLIMVRLLTVSSFFSTCGCFLRVEGSFFEDLPPLSLACGWPLGANGSLSCEWRCLQELRVEGPSGARKRGPNRPPEWAKPAGLGRPAQAHPGPVRSPLPSRGSSCIYALSPPQLALFWWCHPHVQDWGSPCMKSGLLRFNSRGYSFVTLRSLPPLEVISSSSWTWIRLLNCSFELVVNLSFMSMLFYINIALPNTHTKMNLLYD